MIKYQVIKQIEREFRLILNTASMEMQDDIMLRCMDDVMIYLDGYAYPTVDDIHREIYSVIKDRTK